MIRQVERHWDIEMQLQSSDSFGEDTWQKRARRAGLSQVELARLAGVREITVSQGLRGKSRNGHVPIYLQTIIRLWEIADRNSREAILNDLK